jgi:uncharacterized protein (DUF2141 family)
VRTSVALLLSALLCATGAFATATAAAGDPAAAGSATPAATAKPSATLIVEVEGLKDDQGKLHASLYASEEGFPTKPEKALRHVDVPIVAGKARVVFEGLPPGGYAVAAYHDENGDGKLDTGFLGIPTEGLASSNDAKGFMGPPSFEEARVEVAPGENRIVMHVAY